MKKLLFLLLFFPIISFSQNIEDVEVAFAIIENVPVFPGCDKGNNETRRKCMSDKIAKFVQRKFNTERAGDLGLSGRQRISVIFKIDRTGSVTGVRARAPHPILEKEAQRVINLLPKMKPGKHKGKTVIVHYSLPIIVQVQNAEREKKFNIDATREFLRNINEKYEIIDYHGVIIDNNKTKQFLDFLNNSMKEGYSVAKAIAEAKKIALSHNQDNAKLIVDDEKNTKYIAMSKGQYVYKILNIELSNYLGYSIKAGNSILGKVFPVNWIYLNIYIYSISDDLSMENVITKIDTELIFHKSSATNNATIKQIETNFKDIAKYYFRSRCTSELTNEKVYNLVPHRNIIYDEIYSYGLDCGVYMLNLKFGTGNSGKRLDRLPSFSHAFMISISDLFKSSIHNTTQQMLDELNFKVNDPKNEGNQIDLREINTFDLRAMIEFFLEDFKKSGGKISPNIKIDALFSQLPGSTLAIAQGMNNDSEIIIKADPIKWSNSSLQKKWYILYHELGHDVLNLNHGNGGKMMYNFADREYSWEEFIKDKQYMFKSYLDNL